MPGSPWPEDPRLTQTLEPTAKQAKNGRRKMTLSDLKRIVARTPKGVRRIFANDTHITDGHWAYRRDCVIKALPGDFAPEALQRLFGVDAVSILSGLTRVVQSSDHAWSRLPFLTELGDGAAARLYRAKPTTPPAAT